jgi:hypothetical protein
MKVVKTTLQYLARIMAGVVIVGLATSYISTPKSVKSSKPVATSVSGPSGISRVNAGVIHAMARPKEKTAVSPKLDKKP